MTYRDLFSLDGKTVLVTGGSGLIGSEVVRGLAECGASVWAADVVPGEGPRSLELDITDEAAVAAALERVLAECGSLDALVSCAYPRTEDFGLDVPDVPAESFDKNLADHLGGYFVCARAAAELMKAHGGSIVNVASIYGMVGPTWAVYEGTDMTMPAAYAAIKGGIITLSKHLATRYARHGVRVNALSPGGVFDGQPAQFVRAYEERTPLGRMAQPSDVVGAVIYLVSDASAYVTGHNLVVDGGWTAW